MVTLIYRILAFVLALFGAYYLLGAYGWNGREGERFESEMEERGHSIEPDILPYWPAIAALALSLFFSLVARSL